MTTVKFKYTPQKDGRIVMPQYRPGDIVTASNKEQVEYFRTLDCLEEVKTKSSSTKSSSAKSSSTKSDDDRDSDSSTKSDKA